MASRIGPMLRLVLAMGAVLSPLAGPVLNRRLKRGKEDPARVGEKLGNPSAERPAGPLIWLHGVGVGEVMALRGLIERLSLERPDLNFLVTSSARSSAQVIDANLPPRTVHQYLPLDFPGPVTRFLDHWHPDLAVWSDQEVWPRLAVECHRRGIPQAYVAARITGDSAKARARFGAAYGDLYGLMDVIHAQDDRTVANLGCMMGDDRGVTVSGSLKAAGAPLTFDPDTTVAFQTLGQSRRLWLLASSHPVEETVALDAHVDILAADPNALLIIAPRDINRAADIAESAKSKGLQAQLRSQEPAPDDATQVYIADSYGELGNWYRAAPIALIGGTFDAIEGHNPWEAVTLGAAVLHGPRTANFALDYETLDQANAALPVSDAAAVARAVLSDETLNMRYAATEMKAQMSRGVSQITADLVGLLDR